VADRGEPDGFPEPSENVWIARLGPGGDEVAKLLPHRTFSVALGFARERRERMNRALTAAELADVRKLYPTDEYTIAEARLTYQETGEFVVGYGPFPPWDEIEAELRRPPRPHARASAKQPAPRELARQVVAEIVRMQKATSKEKPGPKQTDVAQATKRTVAELRINHATVAEIMRETGLSKTVATRVVREVDAALGRLRAGRY
jgi:hypothetical protein